ncbi:MAG: tRNA pseudouridine(13) synthase TruD [Epsilonproteobacteria bacterium]|nr:tRNA pseudouridine(13) synthase TruD [Campylobacterota bacterium]
MISPYHHAPILSPIFNKNSKNFVVEEKPLYPWSNRGEWLILTIRKKDLTTHELLKILSASIGVKKRDIGYAGLKDKQGLTIQNISIPKKYITQVEKFSHPKIKILQTHLHSNKLKIGHLKGNRFFIRLKKVSAIDAQKIDEVLKHIQQYGIPNYFGYQRFGKDNSALQGKQIIEGDLFIKDRNIEKLLINAYQSELFNKWLEERIKISNILDEFTKKELKEQFPHEVLEFAKMQSHPFKLLPGDMMRHYPHGRDFECHQEDIARFLQKDIAPTGLLSGKKAKVATKFAGEIEKQYYALIPRDGQRRYAWIFPQDIQGKYIPKEWHYELNFYLPKGSYATVLLEILLNKDIRA